MSDTRQIHLYGIAVSLNQHSEVSVTVKRMATRALLPDTFYISGTLLTLPIEGDETIAQWLERVSYVLQEFSRPDTEFSEEFLEAVKSASRLHLQKLLHGVGYR